MSHSNTRDLGQKPQNQPSQNIEKQEQARNVDRSSKRGEIGAKQAHEHDEPPGRADSASSGQGKGQS